MDQTEFAQQALQQKIAADIAERTRIHKFNVARLNAARDASHNLQVQLVNKPMVLLAQGDSWFDYPLTGNGLPFVDTDVIAQLRRIGGTPPVVLNLAHHGDAASDEMSLPKQERIITALRDPSNWLHGQPDAILFSAGGNDIAGEKFCIPLDFNDGKASGLNKKRFGQILGAIEACYRDLFALRDRIVPGVPIYGHCYDFPIPNGAHPVCAGPWLKPSLDFCNWTVTDGTRIVHEALVAFRSLLKALDDDPINKFKLVETQGTLTAAEWANELHPVPSGFMKIAAKFAASLGVRPALVG